MKIVSVSNDDLDAEIARRIMGHTFDQTCNRWMLDKVGECSVFADLPPKYSTDDQTALEVLKRLESLGYPIEITVSENLVHASCSPIGKYDGITKKGPSIANVVSRVAKELMDRGSIGKPHGDNG